MNEEVAGKITKLPDLSKAELQTIWQDNFGRSAPSHLRKELMVPILAYRIQERAFGGLSPRARKRLQEIAETLKIESTTSKRRSSSLRPGTRLVAPGKEPSTR